MTSNLQRRIALYGGSFNPPHVGHSLIVGYVLSTARVDEVWLVPCFNHAFDKELVSFEHRFQMAQLLIQPFTESRVAVTRIEERLGGVSRTIDTVKTLMRENPTYRFDIVIGTDIFPERFEWKSFDELEQLCRFIVIGRAGYPAPPGQPASPDLVTVSSTEVRQMLASGKDVTQVVPVDVAAYIKRNGLYK